MTPSNLAIEEGRTDADVVVYRVTGDLDLASAPALEAAVQAALERGDWRVAIDLSRCGFIDIASLTMILALQKRFERMRGNLAVTGAGWQFLRLLEIYGLERTVRVYKTSDEYEATFVLAD